MAFHATVEARRRAVYYLVEVRRPEAGSFSHVGQQIFLNQEMFVWLAAPAVEPWEAVPPGFRRVRSMIQGLVFALRLRNHNS